MSKSWLELIESDEISCFSTFKHIYPEGEEHSLKVKLKHYLRFYIYRKHLYQVFELFRGERLYFLPQKDRGLLDRIFRPYISKNFSVKQRVKMLVEHYQFVSQVNVGFYDRIYRENGAHLFNISEQFNVVITHDGTFRKEGELNVSIMEVDSGIRVYSCAFNFGIMNEKYALFIGTVQGPERRLVNSFAKIKLLTKLSYGLMPKNLVVMLAMMISNNYGIHNYFGIKNSSHIYSAKRYKISKNRVLFDYDSLWQEFNGINYDDSFMEIFNYRRKPLELIPSKKRSEYKKRFEFIDEANKSIVISCMNGTCNDSDISSDICKVETQNGYG